MTVTNPKMAKFEKMLSIVENTVTKTEFLDAFQKVIAVMQGLKKNNETEFGLIHDNFQLFASKIKNDTTSSLDEIKNQVDHLFVQGQLDKMRKAIDRQMALIDEKMTQVRSGADGRDGQPGPPGPPGETKIIIQRDKRSLSQLEQKLTSLEHTTRTRPGWGAHPLRIEDDGVVVDENARTLNFIGATLTRNADGVISIPVGGGGAPTIYDLLTPDGTTVAFSVPAHSASMLILNGIIQQPGVDYTDGGTTVTYVSAPLGTSDVPNAWHRLLYWS